MKLDNRGWGLREMIIYSSALLMCLLLSAFLINMLYNDVGNPSSGNSSETKTNNDEKKDVIEEKNDKLDNKIDLNYYYAYEDRLVDAAAIYLKKYPIEFVDNSIKITVDTLESSNLINKLQDISTRNICSGYVTIKMVEDEYDIKPYISCDSYITKGY